MADLTLNEYKELNKHEIRSRLLEEYNTIHSGKRGYLPALPVKAARDKGKRIRQFFIRYLKTIMAKKGIPLQGNQPF
jgi:hypothetical protein